MKITLQQWFSDEIKNLQCDPIFITEEILSSFIFTICKEMQETNVTKKDISKKTRMSSKRITAILQGDHDVNIIEMIKISLALNLKFDFMFQYIENDKKLGIGD